jgi:hypothetical protein
MSADEGERGLIENQIEAWIKQHVLYPDKNLHGSCSKVVLRHLNLERKPQGDVASFAVRLEGGAEEDSLYPLLHKIADAAQGDADNLNQGVQSYAVYAYYPSDTGFVPRKLFRVSPSDVEIQRDLSPTEPPTEKGLVSQTQRHLEAVLRTATMTTAHLFTTMQAEMRRLAEMNEKFGSQQIDFLVLMQDLTDNAHKRRLDERKEETSLAMKESALSKLESLLPVIINRIAGQPVLPTEDPSLMLMANLLENLTEAQQTAFYTSLSDAQKMTLAEILHQYELRKSKVLERDKNLVRLGAKHGLPELEPSTSKDLPGDSKTLPMPTALSLRERMRLTAGPSSDPQITKIEADVASFGQKFRDMLHRPTTGETKK